MSRTAVVAEGSLLELGDHPLHGAWYSDASSRITNRAAYQPVLPEQRLRLQMLRCGRPPR